MAIESRFSKYLIIALLIDALLVSAGLITCVFVVVVGKRRKVPELFFVHRRCRLHCAALRRRGDHSHGVCGGKMVVDSFTRLAPSTGGRILVRT